MSTQGSRDRSGNCKLVFPFHYGSESESYAFYRVPKALFESEVFRPLSTDAKLLYGLLNDRMDLSRKNGWVDEEGKVYIYFTRQSVMEALDCGNKKAGQLIEILPAYLTSPKMTADWENQLLMMERGEQDRQSFMGGITQLISQMLQECRQISDDDKQRFSASGEIIQGKHTRGGVGKCPVCGSPVYEGDKTF